MEQLSPLAGTELCPFVWRQSGSQRLGVTNFPGPLTLISHPATGWTNAHIYPLVGGGRKMTLKVHDNNVTHDKDMAHLRS